MVMRDSKQLQEVPELVKSCDALFAEVENLLLVIRWVDLGCAEDLLERFFKFEFDIAVQHLCLAFRPLAARGNGSINTHMLVALRRKPNEAQAETDYENLIAYVHYYTEKFLTGDQYEF
uniref:ARAD1D10978p n=1 Tax=Blastobotrys adeninivorans TaxID=409370 RepID=A0A060T8F7_BLAAD